jgi:hypothetical protein
MLIPRIGKTSDPYSTLVLSPYDDGGIPAATYPNLFISRTRREVTVLQTGQTPIHGVQPPQIL